MKLSVPSALSLLIIAQIVVSQSVEIGAPANHTSVRAGSYLVVEVDRPDTLTPSIEVAVAIGVASCSQGLCSLPSNEPVLGTTLYNGPYHPEFNPEYDGKPPHQNFSVVIPETFPKGPARLVLLHVALVGAENEILTQLRNVTLQVL
ncbi:hypothetical protein CPC08DRAFT_159254 [Agrocybe pediades]|nr:hypothetical protein CPC08DRAFT_159254 [Agrocybe pediades]